MNVPELQFVHRFERGSSDVTLLLLHGTGGDENDLVPLGKELAPEANLLSPRGRVLENGMPRFFRRLAFGVFDVADLERETDALAEFLERAAATYEFDLGRLVAVGYSNGANIAVSLLLKHPGLVREAALMHAMVPFAVEEALDLTGTRILVTSGARDELIPPAQVTELVGIFERAGADVTHVQTPGGHELTRAELDAVIDWLGKSPTR